MIVSELVDQLSVKEVELQDFLNSGEEEREKLTTRLSGLDDEMRETVTILDRVRRARRALEGGDEHITKAKRSTPR